MSAPAAKSLGRVVGTRVVLFAAVAMVAQLIAVLVDYGYDPDNLARLLLEKETAALEAGLVANAGRIGFELPLSLEPRYGTPDSGYVARLRTPTGSVLFSNCDAACTAHFLPLSVNPPDFWLRRTAEGYPLSLAGGRTVSASGHPIFIEVAIARDPEGAVWGVLAHEVLDHMLIPMALTLVFVLGASLLSIRSAFHPVRTAAELAAHIDPMRSTTLIDTKHMPIEVAQLARAVNLSFARVRELMRAQKLFTSAVAHEIRTPLAVIRLELERIKHPRARIALEEIDELGLLVDQLLALARLDSFDRESFTTFGVDDMLTELLTSIAPWVFDRGCSIAFEPSVNAKVVGNAALLKDAVRNLIENAVRHGGAGGAIEVSTDEAGSIAVRDTGKGNGLQIDLDRRPSNGIGLEIVRRIAALHHARLVVEQGQAGTMAAIVMGSPDGETQASAEIEHPVSRR